ncbi:hypothetical protein V2A60_006967 [Cordyceps javanica]
MMGLSQSLAALITQWTNLETSLGAVSRIKSFSEDTPREAEPEARAAEDWPRRGEVSFDNWTAGYSDITILHGITMDILPGQKVALCGRTGSGKSSLVTSILGLVDGTAGRIVIDGVDLSAVRGETVRTAVACVTQDPFLFDSSVRDNLDPAEKKTNAEIEAALRRVGLWPVVSSSALNSGQPEDKVLDLPYEELHLSHGQSQLFCLARAMLRDSRVVLLDEPTSSVDNDTEKQIYDILDGEFKQSTVIMVTHRLTEIRKFDRVAVLNAGDLVEYGRPTDLLVDGESALSALYEAQGPGGGGSSGDRNREPTAVAGTAHLLPAYARPRPLHLRRHHFTLRGRSISGSYAAPWRKHQHVLRVSIRRNILGKCMHWLVTTILPQKLALAFLPVAWSLPTIIVVKKLKPNSDDEFTNELRMYEKLKSLQDNFHLVDGRVVFLDLEYVYELDYDPEHAIQLGRAAILERWNQFREQYEEYGEIEM